VVQSTTILVVRISTAVPPPQVYQVAQQEEQRRYLLFLPRPLSERLKSTYQKISLAPIEARMDAWIVLCRQRYATITHPAKHVLPVIAKVGPCFPHSFSPLPTTSSLRHLNLDLYNQSRNIDAMTRQLRKSTMEARKQFRKDTTSSKINGSQINFAEVSSPEPEKAPKLFK
jgi:hypothetical protein